MGFSWTEDISSGAKIDAADLIEIRTNVDTVDDEKCAAHKISYKLDYKDGDDTSYNPGYFYNQKGSYYSGYLAGYCPTNYPGAKGLYDVGVCTAVYSVV